MEQLLAHLVGDYLLQTDRMATQKTRSWFWAAFHAGVYSVPFAFLAGLSPAGWSQAGFDAWAVIFATHAVIDRYRLARFVVAAKNTATDPAGIVEFFTSPTGFGAAAPPWLATWLLIIADNTLHLLINYAALRWL